MPRSPRVGKYASAPGAGFRFAPRHVGAGSVTLTAKQVEDRPSANPEVRRDRVNGEVELLEVVEEPAAAPRPPAASVPDGSAAAARAAGLPIPGEPADDDPVLVTIDYQSVLKDSQSALKDKEKELSDLHDRYLRLAADFDNFKKRALKERSELLKYANENLAKQLLDVVDNLERARVHAETADKESLLQGVGLVENIFLQTLEKFGVRRFSALGRPFDPAFHEAVQEVAAADAAVGAVLFELQKGYTYHERLLRPSRVVLCKGPPVPVPEPVLEAVTAPESSVGGEVAGGDGPPQS